MHTDSILIADIVGTNARFALAKPSELSEDINHTNSTPYEHALTLQCADFDSISDAINNYLNHEQVSSLKAICFAVAGPVKNQTVQFTNNRWSISAQQLQLEFNAQQSTLLNDFEAIAYSLAQLGESDLHPLGDKGTNTINTNHQPKAVVGPGSGLGIAGLIHDQNRLIPVASEGGHAGFSPDNPIQTEICHYLQGKFGRVSNERLLSGPGLVNIYEAICAIKGIENNGLHASDISQSGANKSDPICVEALELFFHILGQVAGDTALMMKATGGVFIAGGIAQRFPELLSNSQFRSGFENKGRYQELMLDIPTWLVMHKNPGLVGASVFAQQLVDN